MKLNKKIVLSSIVAAMALSFTACGGGGGTTTTTTTTTPVTPVTDEQAIVDNGDFTGSGALQAATRYVANDATLALPATAGIAAADSVDQAAIATLAAGKTLDDTTLTGDITSDLTLTSDKKYKVDGLVKIKGNVTLTIEPGTIIYGDTTGDDFIVVTKGSKIEAAGTEADPIIFTSEAALTDASTVPPF